MDLAIAEPIASQETSFAPLIITPDGVELGRGELDGVPVEWTPATRGRPPGSARSRRS